MLVLFPLSWLLKRKKTWKKTMLCTRSVLVCLEVKVYHEDAQDNRGNTKYVRIFFVFLLTFCGTFLSLFRELVWCTLISHISIIDSKTNILYLLSEIYIWFTWDMLGRRCWCLWPPVYLEQGTQGRWTLYLSAVPLETLTMCTRGEFSRENCQM